MGLIGMGVRHDILRSGMLIGVGWIGLCGRRIFEYLLQNLIK